MLASWTKTLVFVFLSSQLIACSEEGIIKNVSVSAQEQEGDLYVGLTTQLQTNNLQILNITLPVFATSMPGVQVGQIEVQSYSPGFTNVTLKVNLSEVTELPLRQETSLPNGTPFPVWGVDVKGWYSLAVGSSQASKVYLNLASNQSYAILGYALSIDSLSVGIAANVFKPFQADTIAGYGGLYTGLLPDQSGLAVFANIRSLIPQNSFTAVEEKKVVFADFTSVKSKETLCKYVAALDKKKSKIKIK